MADDSDPLRRILRAARSWRVAPSIVLGIRRGTTYEYDQSGRIMRVIEWTDTDTNLMLALDEYEAGLCPGCQHPLEETSRDEHRDAYRPDPPIRCHSCTAQALNADAVSKKPENETAGLLYSFRLDPEIVALNLKPAPPLPPELGGENAQ